MEIGADFDPPDWLQLEAVRGALPCSNTYQIERIICPMYKFARCPVERLQTRTHLWGFLKVEMMVIISWSVYDAVLTTNISI